MGIQAPAEQAAATEGAAAEATPAEAAPAEAAPADQVCLHIVYGDARIDDFSGCCRGTAR